LKKILIVIPTSTETLLISDASMSCNKLLSTLELDLQKLQKQKQGLMQDLLSGRVSV
jgi:hypothetical protein